MSAGLGRGRSRGLEGDTGRGAAGPLNKGGERRDEAAGQWRRRAPQSTKGRLGGRAAGFSFSNRVISEAWARVCVEEGLRGWRSVKGRGKKREREEGRKEHRISFSDSPSLPLAAARPTRVHVGEKVHPDSLYALKEVDGDGRVGDAEPGPLVRSRGRHCCGRVSANCPLSK